MKVVFTPRATRQIEALHDYLCEMAGERTADAYVGRIVAHCRKLSLFPHRGNQRDHILAGLRTVGFERRATIAFTVEPEAVVIEGVFHGGQDFEHALKGNDTHE